MEARVTRRDILRGGGAVVALVVVGVGCKKKEPPTCTDTTGLSPDDVKARESLGYQDRSADPAKACDKCIQYQEGPSADVCSTCKVVKGPVSPLGTCKVFAAKT